MPQEIRIWIRVGSTEADSERAFTFTEAAVVLACSEAKLRSLIESGEAQLEPVASIGRTRLYRESDVEAVRRGRT